MDSRFDTSKDPRFRRIPGHVRKVEVDKRFAHMFHDKRFVETPTVDAQGRRLRKNAAAQKLREFYALAEDSAPAQGEAAKRAKAHAKAKAPAGAPVAEHSKLPKRRKARRGQQQAEAEEEDEAGDDDDDADKGDADAEAAAAEDEDGLDDEGEEAEEEEEESDLDGEDEEEAEPDTTVWETQDAGAEHGDATKRLAVMGCDWEHIRADDLMVMFRTYLTSKESLKGSVTARTGTIKHIAIFPSDYGLEQLAKEAREGPQMPSVEKGNAAHGIGSEEDEERRQAEVIRRYQLQRTRFYYAIAECDSVATATWLYDQMDGIEADGICPATLDMRFVPDGTEPPHQPTSEAKDMPKKYVAPAMLRSAVGHTRVKCTWDETPVQRKKDLMRKKYSQKEAADMDLKAYLASSSDEDEGDAEALRKLVRPDGSEDDDDFFRVDDDDDDDSDDGAGKDKEVLGDMEATFSLKGEELEEKLSERLKEEGRAKKGIKSLEPEKPKSVWETYLERRKAKRRERRQEAQRQRDEVRGRGEEHDAEGEEDTNQDADRGDLELLAQDEDDGRGFNMRGPQRRARQRAEAKQEAAEGASRRSSTVRTSPSTRRTRSSGARRA